MASFNKVILMGNLTRDPEMRFTQSQMAVCKIGLAVNRRYKDSQTGEWTEKPAFVDVTLFGKRAEAFEKFHTKGQSAFIEGRLELDTWEDKNTGQKRSKLYVVADNWEFVGGGKGESRGGGGGGNWESQGGGNSGGGGGGGDYGGGFGDGQQRQQQPQPQQQQASSGGYDGGGGGYGGGGGGGGSAPEPAGGDFLDDTPF
jgi:single-strand DNA-binding protein